MPPIMSQPSKGASHFPAVLHDVKPLAGVLDHFQINLVRLLQAADPVAQPLRLLTSIDPDFPEPGHTRGKIPFQQRDQSQPIIHISSRDDHRHNEPERVHEDMPFASFDFLVSVKADVRPLRRRLDALTIGTARGGFGETPLALAFPLAQRVHNALPYPRQPPAAKVAIEDRKSTRLN